jgi:hypothetical protein
MRGSNVTLQSLKDLPDEAVLTDEQTSLLFNFSKDTLHRLDKTGHGPPVVKLSPRRRGRTVGGLRNWLQKRVVVPVSAPDGAEAS